MLNFLILRLTVLERSNNLGYCDSLNMMEFIFVDIWIDFGLQLVWLSW